ncbi:uncharacterized protein LOC127129439 [Lathyrus oleraceus]|uniref:uncharacterized protein LOC127129439 n=1 Tax=Pisum sativum TaxID=3888 RepID=UPI0021D2EAAD|nr:uncharacterized protein LOC127129439 [Pisum sativum]
MAENKRKAALKAEITNMADEATYGEIYNAGPGEYFKPKPHDEQKNGSLRVCIDFRDLNTANPKDEYPMPVAEMLVDSAAGHEYLSMLDGYSGYNQIFIAEEDVSKTAFRCPGEIGTYEWIVMPFGLKNVGATYQRAMNSIFHDYIETFMQAGDFLGFVVHKKGIEVNQNKMKDIMETKAPLTKKELQSLLGKINFLRRFISNLSGRTQAFSPPVRLKQGKFEWNDEHQKAFDKIKHYLTNPPILAPPCGKKPMRLYISASDTTIETRYTSIEKLCLCLHFSCTKLKYYIKPIDLYVSSHFDVIKYMLSKPIMHSRIGKWALALTEYSLAFMPLRAMKVQIVSDFIVDHAVVESPQLQVELKPWRLFVDGFTHKDGSGVGIMIISPDGIPTKLKYRIEGPLCSNNEVEYEALIAGLKALLELWATRVEIKGDSELVIKQLTKEYKCIKENLIMYFVIANRLLNFFEYIDIKHVPRIKNQEANDLAKIASGYRISKEKLEELVEVRGKSMASRLSPTDLENTQLGYANKEEFEVLAIDTLMGTDWRNPIINYLKDPSIDTERKTKYRALSYVLMGNELFKKTPEGILLKCLGENGAYLALSSVHSGACGAHQVGQKMKWLLLRYGMYWPTMLKDCIEFAKGCQECQVHAGIQHAPASELHAIIKPWPFRGWALDLIGEIRPTSSKGQKYILVGIDYFTKWVEAVSLVNVYQETVIEFIQSITCRNLLAISENPKTRRNSI